MRLELIDGKFVPHLIPEVNVDAAAGTFSVAIDVSDEKNSIQSSTKTQRGMVSSCKVAASNR